MPYYPPPIPIDGSVDTDALQNDSVTSPKIKDLEIVNADISLTAAISLSKLAIDPLARANHTGTQLAATISDFTSAVETAATGAIVGGDLTGTVGNAQIGANVITNAEISPTASIAFSKLEAVPWYSGNDGSGSGLDADLLDGQNGAYYLARTNHTGTQLASTISDFTTAVQGVGDPRYINESGDTMTGNLTMSANTDVVFNNTVSGLVWSDVTLRRSAADIISMGSGDKIQQAYVATSANDLVNKTYADRYFQYDSDTVGGTTSSITPTESTRVTLPATHAGGKFLLKTYFKFRNTNASGVMGINHVQDPDGAATIVQSAQISSDSTTSTNKEPVTVETYIDLPANTNEVFSFEFYHSGGAGSSQLFQSETTIERVSD